MVDRLAKRVRRAQLLERELGEIVEGLDLEPLHKRFVLPSRTCDALTDG
jgi:hypothetical protein